MMGKEIEEKLKGVNLKIGEKIKTLRKERSWTQKELAEKLEISRTYYANLERGHDIFNLKTLVQLSEILDVNLESFFV
jgi:transcriptional regulator with XRE-family HTH domain